MPIPKLRSDIINAAIEGFEHQKAHIDEQIAELRALLPGGSPGNTVESDAPARKRRKFSAAAIRRMREAQQRRWAKIRGEAPQPATSEPEKPKRRISADGMKRIIAATKKRWALKRAAEAATAKKSAPAMKKTSAKKAAVKNAMVKTEKRAPIKKAKTAAKRTAPIPAPAREAAAQ